MLKHLSRNTSLLKADVANNDALKNVPITGFKNDKSLKNHRDACVSQG